MSEINSKEYWDVSHQKYFEQEIKNGYDYLLNRAKKSEFTYGLCLEMLERNLDLTKLTEKSFLEIGCGSPLGSILFHEKLFKKLKYDVNYLDFSDEAIKNCKSIFGKSKKVHYQVQDIIKEPLVGDYGLIAIIETLEHFKEPFNWKILQNALNHCHYLLISTPTDCGTCNGEHVSFYDQNPIEKRYRQKIIDYETKNEHRTILLKGNLFTKKTYPIWLEEQVKPSENFVKETKINGLNLSESQKCINRLGKYLIGQGIEIGFYDHKINPNSIGFDLNNSYFHKVGGKNYQLDGSGLPTITSESMDYVFSSHCLEHLKKPLNYILYEWVRVLKPGGLLILYLPHKLLCGVDELTGKYQNHQFGFDGHNHVFDQYDLMVELDFICDYEIITHSNHGEPYNSGAGTTFQEYSFDLVIKKIKMK